MSAPDEEMPETADSSASCCSAINRTNGIHGEDTTEEAPLKTKDEHEDMELEDDSDVSSERRLRTTADDPEDAEPKNDERVASERRFRTRTGLMPRQWLIDRCDGTSKYNPESRPPCRICWVPIIVKWFPDMLEQNCCCETMGRTGCVDPENTPCRRRLFKTAFIINVIGLLLLVAAAFAMADDQYNVLRGAKFTKVWLQLVAGPQNVSDVVVSFAVGLRAIAFENSVKQTGKILSFDEMCELQQQQLQVEGSPRLLVDANQPKFACHNCQDISKKICPSLFLSMLSYIPNFTTDILRMYSNYDVNCQKCMASTFSWISLATSIYTWVNYRRGCFDSLHTEPFAVNEDFERVPLDSEDVFVVVTFLWRAGLGQICLLLATLLKIIDIVVNIVVPTPIITRDYVEQVEYEWKYGDDGDDNDDDDVKEERHEEHDEDKDGAHARLHENVNITESLSDTV